MASTYTTNLGIEKPAIGEQAGSWGTTVNTNMDIIDASINGIISITLAATGSSGSPNTLDISDGAVDDGHNARITYVDGGDLGGDAYVQLTPNDAEKVVWITNSLSASRSIYLFQGTYDAGRDYVLTNGATVLVSFDGQGAGSSTAAAVLDSSAFIATTGAQSIAGVKTFTDSIQVDNLNVNGNTLSATSGAINITPAAGSAIVLDGTINVDAGVVTGATSISSTDFVGALTGNASTATTAGTVTTAAQPNITSLGTLTALQVDNLNINGNTISATTGAVNITPLAGSAIVLDGTINVDAGVVTGATSITSTAFVGDLSGNASTATTAGTVTTAAQPNITSLGALTSLQVDNININSTTISTDAGEQLNITPGTGAAIVLDGTISVDAGVVTGATSITSGNITITGAAITSSTGAISFSDENLSTTGTLGSGALTCTTFTSTGIDDNATAERVQIADNSLQIGSDTSATNYPIIRPITDGTMTVNGGNGTGVGGNLLVYGSTHATLPNEAHLRTGTTSRLIVSANGGIFIDEIASADTDKTGYGQLWVRSSDGVLMFTNDSGTDYVVNLTAA